MGSPATQTENKTRLNRVEAAKYMGRSLSWLEKRMARNEIPFYKLGRPRGRNVPVEFKVSDLDAYKAKFYVEASAV